MIEMEIPGKTNLIRLDVMQLTIQYINTIIELLKCWQFGSHNHRIYL